MISLMMSGMAGFKEIEIPFFMFFRALPCPLSGPIRESDQSIITILDMVLMS